ncbi:ester cyclase [Reticulibacter mediterranei]|nr:ester cyclase [Reticulibacter mediterranei]
MDIAANKALVRGYIEMWNTGNTALAEEVLATDWMDHAHPEVVGTDSVKQSVVKVRTAFPDFHITIEQVVGEDDMVAIRATILRGGKTSRVMWFVRIVEGKMREMWTGSEISPA